MQTLTLLPSCNMIRNIVTIPDKLLRMKSKRIGYVDDEIRTLASDMIATSKNWEKQRDSELAAALAAVQVGELLQLTVVRENFDDDNNQDYVTLVNPKIVKSSSEFVTDMEGCISVPGIYGRVKRHLKVKVVAQDIDGNEIRLTLEGFPARVLQHEIDHMNGILFLDHVESDEDILHTDQNGNLTALDSKKTKLI